MKRLFSLAITCAALLMIIGCEGEITLVAPNVVEVAVNDGAVLRLTWVEVVDADGYYIYVDGVIIDTITSSTTTTKDVATPGKWVGVSAYAGSDTSAIDVIDCAPVETANITVYALSDPDTAHPSGLAFAASGTAVPTSVVAANYAALDYLFDDVNFTNLTLASPNAYTPEYNDEKNMGVDTDSTDFDAVNIANAPGVYNTQTELAVNAVYALFMDQNDNDWDATNDYFGKIKIESIAGTVITITVAYQPISGLRWLVTD